MAKFKISRYSVKQVKEDTGIYEVDSKIVRQPANAVEIIQAVLNIQDEAQEVFGILTLNNKNAVAGVHVISIGTLNSTIVHPREVFKAAMLNNAASIILFHNHPSGDKTPSAEDIAMTKRMTEIGELMGISVIDSLVIGDGFSSLKERGLI